MKRKVAIGVIVGIIVGAVLMGFFIKSASKTYVSMTQSQFEQLMTAVQKSVNQGQASAEGSDDAGQDAKEPDETAKDDTQEPVQPEPEPAEPTEPPEVILLETEYSLKKRDVSAYDSAYSAMDKSPVKLNKIGKVTVMVFSTQIQEVSVSSNADNFQSYKQLVLSESNNVEEGEYYSFDFSTEAGTRYIFRVTISTGENFYFSIQAPKK